MKLNPKQRESLERLSAFLDNDDLAAWYHDYFLSMGFLPVSYELPKDIESWRKTVKEVLNG